MEKERKHSKARKKSGGDEGQGLLSPPSSSSSAVTTATVSSSSAVTTTTVSSSSSSAVTPTTTTGSSPRSGRSSSGSLFTFEAFRRRSKSDSKPNHGTGTSGSGTSTPSGIHRKSKLFHSFKNHIPWGRSSSIDPASTSGSCQGSGSSHTGTSSHRYHHGNHGNHGNIPNLPNHHHLDPYYTFTYGDTRQHNRPRSRSSSGGGSSGVARVMDIFTRNKSGDSFKDSDKYQTGPHRKSIDFGDLGVLII